MVRTFLTKCNDDSVASLIDKLNNHHESLQHLYHTMCEYVPEVHDHFTTLLTAMEDKDPNWKFCNDFVSLNAFAYHFLLQYAQGTGILGLLLSN